MRRSTAVAVAVLVVLELLQLAALTSAAPAPRTCFGHPATIVTGPGRDLVFGTAGRDVIVTGRGRDVVIARAGDDVICAGPGRDFVLGGRGRDVAAGGAGVDYCRAEIRRACRRGHNPRRAGFRTPAPLRPGTPRRP